MKYNFIYDGARFSLGFPGVDAMTRRFLVLLTLVSLLIAPAEAYVVVIDAPRTVTAGEPLMVNGTSTLPPGYTHDLILCSGSSVELARTTIVVQENGSFSVCIDTKGFAPDDYRVKLDRSRNPGFFGTSSVLGQPVNLVARVEEIGTITSAPTKTLTQRTPSRTPTPTTPTETLTPGKPVTEPAPLEARLVGQDSPLAEFLGAGSLILFVCVIFLNMRDSNK